MNPVQLAWLLAYLAVFRAMERVIWEGVPDPSPTAFKGIEG
jgi:hypothetical protein